MRSILLLLHGLSKITLQAQPFFYKCLPGEYFGACFIHFQLFYTSAQDIDTFQRNLSEDVNEIIYVTD